MGTTVADVSDEAAVDRLFDDVKAGSAKDVLVNNAGIAGPTAAIEDISPADWRRCIDIDLTGMFLARRAVPMLKKEAPAPSSTCLPWRGGSAMPSTPYAAAKWGVIGLTESLARELGRRVFPSTRFCRGSSPAPDREGDQRQGRSGRRQAMTRWRRNTPRPRCAGWSAPTMSPPWCCSWHRRPAATSPPVAQRLRQRRDALTELRKWGGNTVAKSNKVIITCAVTGAIHKHRCRRICR